MPPELTPQQSVEILRAYVYTAVADRLGRELSVQARFAAMDAVELMDRLIREAA